MAERDDSKKEQEPATPEINTPRVAEIAQSSFSAGEVAPSFYGRWDLEKFPSALKECKNFIVRPSGALARRPGFAFCAASEAAKRVKLHPFTFSTGDTFLLALTDGKITVYKDGVVASGTALTSVFTGTSAHTGNPVIFDVRIAQQGDVIYMVHPGFAPQKLTRTGTGTAHADWSITGVTYTPTLAAPTSLSLVQGNTTHERRREWSYVVTSFSDTTGEESVASSPLNVEVFLEANKKINKAKVSWTAASGATAYNVYRGRNGFYGFIGTTKTTSFFDDNFQPVYSITPPTTENPFGSANNYPASVCFYQQRLFYARTNAAPQTVWATMTGIYNQFLKSEPPNDDDAFEHIIAAKRMDEIRALVPLRALTVLTADSEWTVSGPAGGAITPTAIEAVPSSFRGCGWLEPLIVGDRILFWDRTQASLRELIDEGGGRVTAGDALNILSSHLMEGHYVKSWCYQQNPDSIVWAVRDDGILLSLTYLPEHNVWAWAQHSTGVNLYGEEGITEVAKPLYFDDVTCVTEGKIDYVYATITTWPGTGVLTGHSWWICRMKGYGQNAWDNPMLDLSMKVDKRAAAVLTDEVGLAPDDGTLDPLYWQPSLRRGAYFEVGSGTGKVGGITNAGDVVVWEKDGEIVRFTGVGVNIGDDQNPNVVVYAQCDRAIPPCMQYPRTGIKSYTATSSWTLPGAYPFAGGVYLNVCVDGVVERIAAPASSTVTVTTARKGVVAYFGVGYESSAVTMNAAFPGGEGMTRRKRVNAVTVHALSAYRFNVQDGDRRTGLSDFGYTVRDPRWDADMLGWDVGYLSGQEILERFVVAGPWTNHGTVRVLVKETDSGFPIQILGLCREVEIGG